MAISFTPTRAVKRFGLITKLFSDCREMVVNMRKQIGKALVCTGFFLGATMSIQRDITAQEWSQWRGPNRDAISEETGLLSDWSHSEPKLVWQASGLGTGYSSVVVSHDRVFTIGRQQEDLFCIALNKAFDPNSGKN